MILIGRGLDLSVGKKEDRERRSLTWSRFKFLCGFEGAEERRKRNKASEAEAEKAERKHKARRAEAKQGDTKPSQAKRKPSASELTTA